MACVREHSIVHLHFWFLFHGDTESDSLFAEVSLKGVKSIQQWGLVVHFDGFTEPFGVRNW